MHEQVVTYYLPNVLYCHGELRDSNFHHRWSRTSMFLICLWTYIVLPRVEHDHVHTHHMSRVKSQDLQCSYAPTGPSTLYGAGERESTKASLLSYWANHDLRPSWFWSRCPGPSPIIGTPVFLYQRIDISVGCYGVAYRRT